MVLTMPQDIMIIIYEEFYGKSKVKVEMVAMYNKNAITESEINRIINTGEYDKRVIIMTKEQYETLVDRKID